MSKFPFRRAVALGLVLSVALILMPVGSVAAEQAVVVGRVLATDGVTPLSGVVVTLVDQKSRETFASAPSNGRGSFEAQAPAGDYRVVAETPKGAFLAASSVRIAAGANPPVSLMLHQAAGQEPTGTPPAGTPPPPPSQLAPWAKWVIVGGIVVTGALVVNAVTDDAEETQASPSGGGGTK